MDQIDSLTNRSVVPTLIRSIYVSIYPHYNIAVGISQRNHSQHYPHLIDDCARIRSFVIEFFEDVICHRFANNQLSQYVFDIYLDKSDRVWLLDFNVWSIQTDSLLYTWEELVDMPIPLLVGDDDDVVGDRDFPQLRVVERALEVRHDPLASYRAPLDTVTLASSINAAGCGGGDGSTSFESFMAMCQKPSARSDDDDSSQSDGDD
jgi:D123